MTAKELDRRQRQLEADLDHTRLRIRRYTFDQRVGASESLRQAADEAWRGWFAVRQDYDAKPQPLALADMIALEQALAEIDRRVDLIQRELISEQSLSAGIVTMSGLVAALLGLAVVYALVHGVRGLDVLPFEPLPEWGPLKYVEVAFWAGFGVLCWLLFVAAGHISRRDFDRWYGPWYVATFLRAPFVVVMLMLVVLEFVEWYTADTWLAGYLLEEGNKFYFIALLSFCLGLVSEQASAILGDLANGILGFIRLATSRFSERLSIGAPSARKPPR